jgi:hypothetical protein
MKCTNCGKEVPETAKVCGHCGHRLKTSMPPPAPSSPPPPEILEKPTVRGKWIQLASYLKWAGLIFMGIGAAYIPATTLFRGISYTDRLIYIVPFIIIALMFLAWKQPLIAGVLLLLPACRYYFFLLYSGPLLLACLLLLGSGVLMLINRKKQEAHP